MSLPPISDEEYDRAMKDPENVGIIKGVLFTYRSLLSLDELKSLGMVALWRCLQKHNPQFGQKFTTSLFRFVHWECKRELRKKFGKRKRLLLDFGPLTEDYPAPEPVIPPSVEEGVSTEDVKEAMKCLPEPHRKLISQHYILGKSYEYIGMLHGCSKETARQRVDLAMNSLRQICLSGV